MKNVFIASHSHFASGIMDTVEFLLGKCENVTVFDAYLDSASLEDKLDEFFQESHGKGQRILISDLYGGSVNSTMYRYLNHDNTILLTGVNVAFLLELLATPDEVDKEEMEELLKQSRELMKIVEIKNEEEQEDFF